MDNSYNIIRRFTPPTCTLEIWGKNSPLSRWTKKKAVREIQFKLSFDDPKNLDAEPIVIEGDRDKLERLYTTVLDYTGNFLEQSFNSKSLSLVTTNNESDSDRPYLTSQGLVNHQLNLGSLSSDKTSSIALSATQLCDLVSALEDYQTEMVAIAELKAKQDKRSRSWLPLGASVAGILLAIGVVTAIKTTQQTDSEEQIAATQETPVAPITPQEEVVPPEAPEVAEKPAVGIQEDDPLSSTEILPPPPAVDTPKPPPNIPDPAKYPPSGNLTIPPKLELPKQNEVTLNPTESTPETQPSRDDSQVESKIEVSPVEETTESTATTEDTEESTSDSPVEETTESTATTENSELEIEPNPQVSVPTFTENNEIDSLENVEEAEIAIANENAEIDTDIVGKSNRATAFNEATIPQEAIENNVEENAESGNAIALDDTVSKPTTDGSTITEDEPESKISQIVQLREIENYFQQKWQSPSELKQTLEYRLILSQDGSLRRIIPIGKASEIFVDRTNIPLMGEPFVSPLQDNDTATIRLLLSPDGEVKTFLE